MHWTSQITVTKTSGECQQSQDTMMNNDCLQMNLRPPLLRSSAIQVRNVRYELIFGSLDDVHTWPFAIMKILGPTLSSRPEETWHHVWMKCGVMVVIVVVVMVVVWNNQNLRKKNKDYCYVPRVSANAHIRIHHSYAAARDPFLCVAATSRPTRSMICPASAYFSYQPSWSAAAATFAGGGNAVVVAAVDNVRLSRGWKSRTVVALKLTS